MVRLFVLLAAVQLVLVVLGLISSLSADRVRTMPRVLWVLVILLIPLLGPIAYFLFGRPISPPSEGGPVRRAHPRPVSPDDDPDFLRSMNTEQSRRERELLEQWEKELQDRDREEQAREERAREERARAEKELRDRDGEEKGPRPPA
jgi:hypothetical protein